VHLDVRPSNVLCTGDSVTSRALVIDWGFAVAYRKGAAPYEGTVRYASPSVLATRHRALLDGKLHMHEAKPADDLHSWIRMCYAVLHPHVRVALSVLRGDGQLTASDVLRLQEWWRQELVGPWLALAQAVDAHDVDYTTYAELYKLVASALPPLHAMPD
jgi:hypothetical protein